MSTNSLTSTVAAWIHKQSARELPAEVEHHMRRMILDHLSGVIPASTGEVSNFVSNHVQRHYGKGPATAFGIENSTALGAALLNGTSAHGIETDDGYTPGSFHPTCVVLPAVFALAEERNSSTTQILRAAAIGMEVGCRLAAAGHPATRRRGFHNTAIAGVFGAAAASAVLLELDEIQTLNALGIAGSHAGGLFEFLGSSAEVKRLHPGKAARDGIAAADLAFSGLTGPATVLEGEDGYFSAYAGTAGTDWHPETILNGLGEQWAVMRSYIKPYPCCRHLHGAIDGVLALSAEHSLNYRDITTVHIGTFSIAAGHTGTEISTMMGAQLSLPYAVAVALQKNRLTLADFSEENRNDPEVHSLMSRITVEIDETADQNYPLNGRPAAVTITVEDGTSYTTYIQHPYGEPDNPMTDQDLEQKARDLVEPIIGAEGADLLIKSAWTFQDLSFLTELNNLVITTRSHDQTSAELASTNS